jgi:hypothetical protein
VSAPRTIDEPEFHIVVKRPRRAGPLAPYRFSLAVLFAALVSGRSIWYGIEMGVVSDDDLIRAGGAGLFMWVLSGIINRILASSAAPTHRRPDPTGA